MMYRIALKNLRMDSSVNLDIAAGSDHAAKLRTAREQRRCGAHWYAYLTAMEATGPRLIGYRSSGGRWTLSKGE